MSYVNKLDLIFEDVEQPHIWVSIVEWIRKLPIEIVEMGVGGQEILEKFNNPDPAPEWDPESDQLLDAGDEWGNDSNVFLLLAKKEGQWQTLDGYEIDGMIKHISVELDADDIYVGSFGIKDPQHYDQHAGPFSLNDDTWKNEILERMEYE